MIKTNMIMIVVVLFIALSFTMTSCADKKPATPAPVETVAVPATQAADTMDADALLTVAEQTQLKTQFVAEANAEITIENAEQIAAALETEIEKELAAED